MRKELDDELCRKYPLLYRDRNASKKDTCMCWGFECKNGWLGIIDNLSSVLEGLILALPVEERTKYRASQVKEKFGTLRFYMTHATADMAAAIQKTEGLSAETCENCGASAAIICESGWYRVRCGRCIG